MGLRPFREQPQCDLLNEVRKVEFPDTAILAEPFQLSALVHPSDFISIHLILM